jgi:hypothetical protein
MIENTTPTMRLLESGRLGQRCRSRICAVSEGDSEARRTVRPCHAEGQRDGALRRHVPPIASAALVMRSAWMLASCGWSRLRSCSKSGAFAITSSSRSLLSRLNDS